MYLKTIIKTCHYVASLLYFADSPSCPFVVMFFLQKKDLKTSEPHPQPQGLSLPIDEKTSVQVCFCAWVGTSVPNSPEWEFFPLHDVTCSQQH